MSTVITKKMHPLLLAAMNGKYHFHVPVALCKHNVDGSNLENIKGGLPSEVVLWLSAHSSPSVDLSKSMLYVNAGSGCRNEKFFSTNEASLGVTSMPMLVRRFLKELKALVVEAAKVRTQIRDAADSNSMPEPSHHPGKELVESVDDVKG
ncbi:uncharacterized protein A4U43_C02F16220 [Asparagus officinalis]|uniref:Uncharacterized protein n=1 Tax=Asparagus officinalis TaxID=4686 RepID=A0A5P1FNP6_ASPOF|nr:uncharacterized protein A4U43_C02F16220 [Asparagus officinalis]